MARPARARLLERPRCLPRLHRRSRGEFTVAKDQNVRLRSGWFSDRSATYLAAGRPVITQETGFSNVLPTGEGLFGFTTIDEVVEAVGRINADYERQPPRARPRSRASTSSHDVVLSRAADRRRRSRARRQRATSRRHRAPADLALSLDPARATADCAPAGDGRGRPRPTGAGVSIAGMARRRAAASIVVVTHDNLVFTRMCLESVLGERRRPATS